MICLDCWKDHIWPWHIGLRWTIVALWATCFILSTLYIFGVKYINFTWIFGEKLFLFDRPKLFIFFYIYFRPPTDKIKKKKTKKKNNYKSIDKNILALRFWFGVRVTPITAKLRPKIVWPPYWKNRVFEIFVGSFPSYYIDWNINFCIKSGWAACNIMSLELRENSTLCRAKI